jgi:hypothetical protein
MNKIDFFVIPPLTHLELMDYGDRFFCLAQLYKKSEEYRAFFKQRVAEGKWVTLDNGVGDHDFISQDELFAIMKDLMPSEIIPLDVLKDGDATFRNAVEFILRMREEGLLGKIQTMCVPQGNDLEEWLECYIKLSNLKEVDTIGMSKIGIPWVVSRSTKDQNIARDRNVIFDYLTNEELLRKPMHFLGAGSCTEFEHYKGSPYVRSTDSCFTVFLGMQGVKFEPGHKRIPTPRDYFEREISPDQMVVVKENIATFRDLLN